MQLGDLEPNHSVELQVSMNGKNITLLTVLEQSVAPSALLSPLTMNGKVVGFPATCDISFLYPTKDKVYVWYGVKMKTVRYENKIYHSAELIGDADTINRRGAYRVYIGERMKITTFTSEGPKPVEVLIKDISETGFAFLSPENFDVGRTVRLNLDLEKGILKLSAQLVRIQTLENRQDILYGCQFSEHNSLLGAYLMKIQQRRQKEKMGNAGVLLT